MKGVGDGDGDVGKYIHFANFPSLMHVRFGVGGAESVITVSERLGSNRKSMTSHLSIWISWINSDGLVPVPVIGSGIRNKQYARFFIPTSKLMIRIFVIVGYTNDYKVRFI